MSIKEEMIKEFLKNNKIKKCKTVDTIKRDSNEIKAKKVSERSDKLGYKNSRSYSKYAAKKFGTTESKSQKKK
jgi:hypothetical protein